MASSPLLHYLRIMAGVYRDDTRSDSELLSRFAATHDETAFASLVVRHGHMVWDICRRLLGNTPDAEDAFQASFQALTSKANKIRVTETLAGWLHHVARQAALQNRRKAGSRRKLQKQLQEQACQEPASENDPDEVYEALHDELAKLPEKLRVPLVLHHLEGKTQLEVARVLGVTEPAVRKRLVQGRSFLQRRLARRGLSAGAATLSILLEESASRAALPAGLIRKTVQTAMTFRNGATTGGIAELARQVLRRTPSTTPWWMKGWLIGLVCVAGLGLGGAGIAWKTGLVGNKADGPPAAMEQDASQENEKAKLKPVRLDFYRDPLPEHALARMGTVRLKQQSSPCGACLVFSPDGKILASQNGGWEKKTRVWDAASGRKLLELGDQDEAVDVALAFSADGRRLATANARYAVHVWDSASGRLIRTYKRSKNTEAAAGERPHSLLGMHFSPKGKIRVVEEQIVFPKGKAQWEPWGLQLRDVATGEVVSLKDRPKNVVEAVAFSPNGGLLATASHLDFQGVRGSGIGGAGDIEINLWNVGTGEKVRRMKIKAERDRNISEKDPNAYYSTSLRKLTFSPDGKILAALKSSTINNQGVASVYLWEAATGKKINRLSGGSANGLTRALAFSPHGKQLLGGDGRLWNTATGDRIRLFPWGNTSEAAFSPTGKIAATVEGTGQIRLWDVDAGKELGPRTGPREGVETIAFSSDGKTLVSESAGAENMFRWWDVATGKEIGQRPARLVWTASAIFSSDGNTRLALESIDTGRPLMPESRLTLSDSATGKEIVIIREKYNNESFPVLSHDGKKLAMIAEDEAVHVWNAETGEQIYKLATDNSRLRSPYRVAFSTDGKLLAASSAGATVVFWEMATGQVVGSLAEQGLRTGWEKAPGRPKPVPRPAESLSPMLFSPDGRTLVTMTAWTNGNRSCELREAAGGRKIYDLPSGVYLNGLRPPCFAFSPDGRLLAFAGTSDSDSSAVHLVDAASGREVGPLTGHQDRVDALVFSSDGRKLASCSADATCLIWDMTGFGPGSAPFTQSSRQRPKQLSQKELETAWRDLGLDSAKAYRAVWDLSAAPAQAIALLQARIRPAASLAKPERLERWIADLDSNRFAVRQKALRNIEELGEAAVPQLRQALKGKLPIETRRQVQESLAKIKAPLREIRAVQVLEYIGTPAAQKSLQGWAQGLCEAKLTQDAQAALARLAKRTAVRP